MNIAIIGRTNMLLETIKLLSNNKLAPKLIITSKQAEHDSVNTNHFKNMAKKIGAKFILSSNINDEKIKNFIQKYKIELGISVNNPLLINQNTISLFRCGILNAHAGDLPRYRGNACPNWAILNDEKQIVLTIHFMDEGLDSGDILLQKKFIIKNDTRILDFYEFAEQNVPKMFLKSVLMIKNKKYTRKKQSKKQSDILRTYPRNRFDGKIDWNDSVLDIDKLIRVSGSPFFGAYTYFQSKKLYILDAKIEKPKFRYLSENGQIVERRVTGEIVVACKDGFLVISKVLFNDRFYEKPNKLIKTIHTRFGMNVEEEIEKLVLRFNNIINEK